MLRRRALGGILAAVVLATGCADGGGDAGPSATTTTEVGGLDGDPDSPFCRRSRDGARRPLLDPFEAGLDPGEVERRFRALAQRFEGLAELAPEPLEEDMALVDERFDELAAVLEEAGYDFEELVASGADLSVFDDPELATVAERLSAYQDQVCAGTEAP